jgi:NDP-sugar pyrophosphorylase family protein
VIDRHVVLLAGGRGTRLRPYTTTIPKPLVPIGDECAIVEIILRQLARDGFTRAILAIGHLGQLIRAYVGSGDQWGIDVEYEPEDQPLGTMGPVVGLLDRLPSQFLVMNGDILTDLSYRDLLDRHIASGAPITVATARRDVEIDFGTLEVEGDAIIAFREKPVLPYRVSMGVYALSRETLHGYPRGQHLGFDDVMVDLIAAGRRPASYAHAGYWLDIGRPEDYDRANLEFDERRSDLLPGG